MRVRDKVIICSLYVSVIGGVNIMSTPGKKLTLGNCL